MIQRRSYRFRRLQRPPAESLRRGIYLIPTLFTVGNMLAGFTSILFSLNGRIETAGWLILLAGVLDGLDGRVARLAKVTSEFGKEYDSLADVVSFGVAPAVLVYQWGLWGMGRWGWMAGFLFLVAGSVRLARFNVKSALEDSSRFTGLPIPGGAGALTMMVLVAPEPVVNRPVTVAVWAFVLTVSFLMVSTIPYRSYKDLNLRRRFPATTFFLMALVLAVIAVWPVPTLATLAVVYLLSGPLEYLRRRRSTPASPPPPAEVHRAEPDSQHP